jgi:hypothetical protein
MPKRPRPEQSLKAQWRPEAKIVKFDQRAFPVDQPDELTAADALRIVRILSADTSNIVVIRYGRRRARQRAITHHQIELCVQRGTITEGPFLNQRRNWQMNLYRHAAGEEITCVVVIDWVKRVLVLNTF